jgi:translation elongation factor EF-Tu-like GTPase
VAKKKLACGHLEKGKMTHTKAYATVATANKQNKQYTSIAVK